VATKERRKQGKGRWRKGSLAPVGRPQGLRLGLGFFLPGGRRDLRAQKWFTPVDEYTGECQALEVERLIVEKAVASGAAAGLSPE
jgi:hypothetical protein